MKVSIMTSITVIGTGHIGSAVAGIASKGKTDLQVLARDRNKAADLAGQHNGTAGTVGDPITGDIVVLAVPHAALAELADLYGTQLDGKTLVDVSNPIDYETFDSITVAADSSAAAELQAKAPAAHVIKAFNTNFAETLVTGKVGDAPTTVLVAGDNDDAKQGLVDVVTAGGLDAVTVGSLKRARELEALAFLQMTLAVQGTVDTDGGFAIRK